MIWVLQAQTELSPSASFAQFFYVTLIAKKNKKASCLPYFGTIINGEVVLFYFHKEPPPVHNYFLSD